MQPSCDFSPSPLLYILNSPGHLTMWYNINHCKAEFLKLYDAQLLRKPMILQIAGLALKTLT